LKFLLNANSELILDTARFGYRGEKNGTFAPFLYENEHFAKTGSGQT
jgi:hypothetical protein